MKARSIGCVKSGVSTLGGENRRIKSIFSLFKRDAECFVYAVHVGPEDCTQRRHHSNLVDPFVHNALVAALPRHDIDNVRWRRRVAETTELLVLEALVVTETPEFPVRKVRGVVKRLPRHNCDGEHCVLTMTGDTQPFHIVDSLYHLNRYSASPEHRTKSCMELETQQGKQQQQ